MEKCSKCGNEIKAGDNFCASCGEALTLLADNLYKMKAKNAQMQVLRTLSKKLKDPESLIMLKKLMDYLASK